jgi:hypothetical protein
MEHARRDCVPPAKLTSTGAKPLNKPSNKQPKLSYFNENC